MLKTKLIIDISDAKVSKDPNDQLVTYSLGSCIGVCFYDRANKIGGMIHYQLPDSKIDPNKAKVEPYMFADTGLKSLIDELVKAGANKKRLVVKVAGGAEMNTGPKGFDIGKRNFLALRKVLWQKGVFVDGQDIGGNSPRNLYMDIETGEVTVRSIGIEKKI
jgi:chemotaxis protein CheD